MPEVEEQREEEVGKLSYEIFEENKDAPENTLIKVSGFVRIFKFSEILSDLEYYKKKKIETESNIGILKSQQDIIVSSNKELKDMSVETLRAASACYEKIVVQSQLNKELGELNDEITYLTRLADEIKENTKLKI